VNFCIAGSRIVATTEILFQSRSMSL